MNNLNIEYGIISLFEVWIKSNLFSHVCILIELGRKMIVILF